MVRSISYICILGGTICYLICCALLYQRNTPKRLAFAYESYLDQKAYCKADPTPLQLHINDLGIHLPIIATKVEKDYWETTSEGVSYLSSSVAPGRRGNSILYGHNWRNLLGNLIHAKPGQKVEVLFTDGSRKVFTIDNIGLVEPTETTILKNTDDKRITIYTCAGFLDSKRFVVTAKLDEMLSKN